MARTHKTLGSALRGAGLRVVVWSLALGGGWMAASGLGVAQTAVQVDQGHAGEQTQQDAELEARAHRIEVLMGRFQCSADGLRPGVIPAHAVVEKGDRLRVVSFDEGWAVYQGRRPGTVLLGVCAR